MKLIIQIPCWNEAATLPEVAADLPAFLPGFDNIEYLVVDDGSEDGTCEVARELKFHHIVQLPRHIGLARAYIQGLEVAVAQNADVVANTDGDHQYRGVDLETLVKPILEGKADLVIGVRPVDRLSKAPWSKRGLYSLGRWVTRLFSGSDFPDPPSGFRAMTREVACRMLTRGRYTYTLETLLQASFEGWRIAHVSIGVNPPTRPSRLIRSQWQYVFRAAHAMIRTYLRYRAARIFAILGGVLLLGCWFWPSFGALAIACLGLSLICDRLGENRELLEDLRYRSLRKSICSQSHAYPQSNLCLANINGQYKAASEWFQPNESPNACLNFRENTHASAT